jgi:hypothetical protein
MLMQFPDGLDGKNDSASWGAKKVFLCTSIGAVLGLTYGLALGFLHHGVVDLGAGALFTSVFGGFVGLIAGLLFASLRKVRRLAAGSTIRMALVFAVLGGIPGALVFSLFSEGVPMALYQAGYGSIVGGLIGTILGFLMTRFGSK